MGSPEFDGAAGAYDEIVRELYSAGLALYGMAGRLGPGPSADLLLQVTAHVDAAIKRLGGLVLALADRPTTGTGRLAARLCDTISTVTPALVPTTRLVGPVGDLPEDVVDDLLAVVRHTVTDLAGNADDGALEVDVTVADGWVSLQVATDGVWAPTSPDGGLGDTGRRAAVGGAHTVTEPRPSGGTRLTWSVPLLQPQPSP